MTPLRPAVAHLRNLVLRLRAFRLDDGEGLPAADPRDERLGRGLMLAATVLLALVGLWEIAGPFAAGHYAASTAVALSGENMWHFGVIAPVPRYLPGAPSPSDFYCHHPFGMFWTAAIFAVFGHHDWVCRVPAVLMSTAMPWLIHRAARAAWSPVAGGISALSYAVLPITLAYAQFFALEVPTLFGMALGIFGLVRFLQAGTTRYAIFALLGFGYAASVDWPGMLFSGLVLGGLFLRGFVFKRVFPPLAFERFATFWATLVALLAAVILFHVAAIVKLDQIQELVRSGEFRALGADRPLSEVLAVRAYWIALAFTPVAVAAGKVALPLLAVRLLVRRGQLEILVLCLFATAAFQYVVFKQGADIHFFWPQYFALYAAYAFGALAVTLEEGVRRHFAAHAGKAALASFSLGLLAIVLIVPDGLTALRYARKTGGRFNEKGLIIHPDFDKQAALAHVARRLPDAALVGLEGGMKQMYWMDWTLERPVAQAPFPTLGQPLRHSHFALDRRFAAPAQITRLIEDFSTTSFGPYLVADLRAVTQPVEAFALVRREPTLFERLFVSTNHPRWSVEKNPFVSWEVAEHFGTRSSPHVTKTPRTFEELRIAHNMAVARNDEPAAKDLRRRLLAELDPKLRSAYSDGVTLLGCRLARGASDVLTVYFEAGESLRQSHPFGIVSFVEEAPVWSLTPRDELPWDVGMPFAIPTTFWKAGYIYASETELLRRPGRERYEGAFRGRGAPVLESGDEAVVLLTLE